MAVYVYLVRGDGQVARAELGEGEDVWEPLARDYPLSYDLVDERSVLEVTENPDRRAAARFGIGEDGALAEWLREGQRWPRPWRATRATRSCAPTGPRSSRTDA